MSTQDRLNELVRRHSVNSLTSAGTMNGTEALARALLIAYDNLPPEERLPIPMRLPCPQCHALHIDEGEFATKVHTAHACQFCGMVWRPAVVPTVGVRFLPGFKNEMDKT